MIFVGGLPFSTNNSSWSSSSSQGSDILVALLEHPVLVSASHSFKSMEETKVSVSSETPSPSKYVYVFQREYATVDPALVDYVGTDEATTCVGLVIRNRRNRMTSIAHMDNPEIVDIGLCQMLSLVVDHDLDAELDHANVTTISECYSDMDGYSLPLCRKLVDTLQRRQEKFHVQTLHVLGHNTKRDSQGNAYPIFHGFLVETCTGSLSPASFDGTSRCPDEMVRRIRVTSSYEDTSWNGKLLETYDTQTDRFVIAPCRWTVRKLHIVMSLQQLSDEEILRRCSTSPSAEGPDFVENLRRQWNYLIKRPDWRETFPWKQPRVFQRAADGGWRRC
ncbi:protein N-terminal asparagine amidohydrolase [Citrus sinensis]|uniref:protein N-terminal asparagine amidohydrolase isoform X2 n=1 Tax=Citrus sinensis TaxID=2711 RepID=UPI0003D74F86|nr:protein N-terminal asparagine amidohydrolase isoform X2 [Citrus sinensis]KAH9710349.1 protein N-terminal asparagine amidohydrolase [Citrus sinensis]